MKDLRDLLNGAWTLLRKADRINKRSEQDENFEFAYNLWLKEYRKRPEDSRRTLLTALDWLQEECEAPGVHKCDDAVNCSFCLAIESAKAAIAHAKKQA